MVFLYGWSEQIVKNEITSFLLMRIFIPLLASNTMWNYQSKPLHMHVEWLVLLFALSFYHIPLSSVPISLSRSPFSCSLTSISLCNIQAMDTILYSLEKYQKRIRMDLNACWRRRRKCKNENVKNEKEEKEK